MVNSGSDRPVVLLYKDQGWAADHVLCHIERLNGHVRGAHGHYSMSNSFMIPCIKVNLPLVQIVSLPCEFSKSALSTRQGGLCDNQCIGTPGGKDLKLNYHLKQSKSVTGC